MASASSAFPPQTLDWRLIPRGKRHVRSTGGISCFCEGARSRAAIPLGNPALSGGSCACASPRRSLAFPGGAVFPGPYGEPLLAVSDRHRHSPRGEDRPQRSEEHTSELQSLMRISYAVFCLKKKTRKT